jgi:peptidoglycan/xylan/chitin deacetylase (PgdA/CDA1 family)
MRVAVRRGGHGDADDPEHDSRRADDLTPPDALDEDARREHEQEDDAEREDRLNQRQRGTREREELERPADAGERDRREPERAPDEPREKRETNRSLVRYSPYLECLNGVGRLVADCRRSCGERADGDDCGHRCDDGAVRPRALGALVIVGAGAVWSAPAPAPFSRAFADRLDIRTRLTEPRGVALTFDDGPHREGTPAVLEALARSHARATFFLVGEQVERMPSLAAEIVARGHEVALHGYRHRLLLRRTTGALAHDLDRASSVIHDATGQWPSWYRPPYGVFSLGALRLVRARGWRPVLWSTWGRDWGASATPAAIARKATAGLRAGDVVLLHDADHYSASGSWRRTTAALPAIIESATALGEPLVSLTQST